MIEKSLMPVCLLSFWPYHYVMQQPLLSCRARSTGTCLLAAGSMCSWHQEDHRSCWMWCCSPWLDLQEHLHLCKWWRSCNRGSQSGHSACCPAPSSGSAEQSFVLALPQGFGWLCLVPSWAVCSGPSAVLPVLPHNTIPLSDMNLTFFLFLCRYNFGEKSKYG